MMPVPALTAPAAPAVTGAVLCAISWTASREMQQGPLAISLPKLPEINIDLPNPFGKKKDTAAPTKPMPKVARAPASGNVVVRPSTAVQPLNPDAPTSGLKLPTSISTGKGYRRFPIKRMPGANMDDWKKIAKEITPDP